MPELDLTAIAERYHRALDSKPGKGPISEKGIAAITDSVCDVPTLMSEVERLRSGAKTLGTILDRSLMDVVAAAGAQDLIDAEGDGDWALVWERLHELRPRAEVAEAALRDFAEHGTRHDLTPTMPGGDEYMHLTAYIRSMDAHVRETARRALGVER